MPDYIRSYQEHEGQFVHQRQRSVDVYDVCRWIDPVVIARFVSHLLASQPKRVLEAGVGNGRIFGELAKQASHDIELVGLDISPVMLAHLRGKLARTEGIRLHESDLRDPRYYESEYHHNVDVIFTFATIHIISQNWQKALDNFIASRAQGGMIVLGEELNTVFYFAENIDEGCDFRLGQLHAFYGDKRLENIIEQVRKFFAVYHKFRKEEGWPFYRHDSQILYVDQTPGERYLRLKGFTEKTIAEPELHWLKPHTYRDILDSLEHGTVTQFGSDMPPAVRLSIRQKLEDFCRDEGYDIDAEFHVPAEIQLHMFTREI